MARQRSSILESTPLRLTVALIALFAIVFLLTFAATYTITRSAMLTSLNDSLVQEMTGFRAAPSAEALSALVRSQSSVTDPKQKILSYLAPGGFVAGNAALLPEREGFRAIALGSTTGDGSGEIDGEYFTLTERLRGGLMTIAFSAAPVDELGATFIRVFLFSLLPTTAIALCGGLLLARRSARRLDALETTLDRLTAGDLKARVPTLPGRADDLTRIGERIDRMAVSQEAQVSALRQVSADIAHDLKTPIQRVSVMLNRLKDDKRLPSEAVEIANQATAETDRIVAIFQALLQIAQIEGGSPRARFAEVDIAALSETFAEVYTPAAEESGHRLVCSRPAEPVRVSGDKTLLGQAIANLVENALRHTPPGTVVTLELDCQAGQPVLSVADTGPGIPEAERDNALRRLYRLETSRTTPGSGLGLSLVAVIADLHGAKLSLVDNAPGLRAELRFPPVAKSEHRPEP
ncbi:putative sensor histidine kinase TcrY [Defluviimonas aquaemixtae]|uniref:histidine kinase n=1 Tax=Albidovulum aquaemixtae TaxID=1542388 RepID=A0A2R8B8R0_9RHOB|nr:HAMP domain-containing sensor histidine kinase [Defluviimonas aquaemixtae]SPH18833.1 putative sensor histidine kinase TcrY [Defluviimonas aquaemixtae]